MNVVLKSWESCAAAITENWKSAGHILLKETNYG
jgi:hypothetical protein